MKRSTTPSYIAQYRLLCTPDDGKFIGHCLFLGCKTYNIMVGEANKRLNSYYRDKEVNAIRMKQRKRATSSATRKRTSSRLSGNSTGSPNTPSRCT